MKNLFFLFFLFAGILIYSCEKEEEDKIPDVNYNPVLIPSNFVDSVTNIYFPLIPGKVYTYIAQTGDGSEDIVVSVLSETKMVAGIQCTVVSDIVSVDGQTIEDTHDWYAQEKDGNALPAGILLRDS
jgi:hypothetical protein